MRGRLCLGSRRRHSLSCTERPQSCTRHNMEGHCELLACRAHRRVAVLGRTAGGGGSGARAGGGCHGTGGGCSPASAWAWCDWGEAILARSCACSTELTSGHAHARLCKGAPDVGVRASDWGRLCLGSWRRHPHCCAEQPQSCMHAARLEDTIHRFRARLAHRPGWKRTVGTGYSGAVWEALCDWRPVLARSRACTPHMLSTRGSTQRPPSGLVRHTHHSAAAHLPWQLMKAGEGR